MAGRSEPGPGTSATRSRVFRASLAAARNVGLAAVEHKLWPLASLKALRSADVGKVASVTNARQALLRFAYPTVITGSTRRFEPFLQGHLKTDSCRFFNKQLSGTRSDPYRKFSLSVFRFGTMGY